MIQCDLPNANIGNKFVTVSDEETRLGHNLNLSVTVTESRTKGLGARFLDHLIHPKGVLASTAEHVPAFWLSPHASPEKSITDPREHAQEL